jgi:hypothetical protein
VPAGDKPTAIFTMDLAVAANLQHNGRFQTNWTAWTAVDGRVDYGLVRLAA